MWTRYCSLITALVQSDEILEAVASNPELFELLFTASDVPHESDSVMATYFARVVAHVLTQRGSELVAWLKVTASHPMQELGALLVQAQSLAAHMWEAR